VEDRDVGMTAAEIGVAITALTWDDIPAVFLDARAS
jgi:hypothetical protein